MRNRVLVLPIAASIIVALTAYKLLREERSFVGAATTVLRPVVTFELFNSESPPKSIRIEPFLGRHPIIVVFFDGEAGADRDPIITWLVQETKRIENANIKVFAISGAFSAQNRHAIERLQKKGMTVSFPLLTDIPPTEGAPALGFLVHKQWGRYDEQKGLPLQGIFLIDPAGRVKWNERGPQPTPLGDPQIERFLTQ